MTDPFSDDLPTELTRMLRGVDGVHTVYATSRLLPTIVTAVVEAVKNEPVGMHLVSVEGEDEDLEVSACVGVFDDEPAPVVCRRARDALSEYFAERGLPAPRSIRVQIGRVG